MHLFIVNPAAGGKKHDYKKTERKIEAVMRELDEPYEIYVTKAPMDACKKIEDAAKSADALRVYACGGDGTLNECVNGAAGLSNVSVTHYPCGTGNDFIKMFGDQADMFRDLKALVTGSTIPLDLIECNGRYSINICSVGIDARIGTDVHKYSSLPIVGGAGGYVISLIVNLARGISRTMTVKTSQSVESGGYTLICACNGRFYGGGFNPVPDAMPNDGLIDFLIVPKVSRARFIKLVGKYAKGKYREMSDVIKHYRGTDMEISSDEETVVNVDGEAIYGKNIHFRMVPDAIELIIPAGMTFLN